MLDCSLADWEHSSKSVRKSTPLWQPSVHSFVAFDPLMLALLIIEMYCWSDAVTVIQVSTRAFLSLSLSLSLSAPSLSARWGKFSGGLGLGCCQCRFCQRNLLYRFPCWLLSSSSSSSSSASFRRGDFAPREPEFGVEFWDANFGAPNFGAEL